MCARPGILAYPQASGVFVVHGEDAKDVWIDCLSVAWMAGHCSLLLSSCQHHFKSQRRGQAAEVVGPVQSIEMAIYLHISRER